MTISELQQYPSTFIDPQGQRCHESLLQGFQVLRKVEELLQVNTPAPVILEIIQEARSSSGRLFCCAEGSGATRDGEPAPCLKCQNLLRKYRD